MDGQRRLHLGRSIWHAPEVIEFKYVQDLEDWLEPMSYTQFWDELGHLGLKLHPKEQCDGAIARGLVDEAVVVDVLKMLARIELKDILGLEWRCTEHFSLH